ncbi:Hyaluronidase [Aphelenchoides fujianensis]|nr:Hyaluronidase [Aphelenchoides fujianensis]
MKDIEKGRQSIYWNVPSDSCKQVQPEAYGITTNTGNRFLGDKLVIFYSFGKLPYCNKRQELMALKTKASVCKNAVDGGLPQVANFTAHFAQIEADINERIPNVSFDGLAIVDYEAWRPVWELNHSSRRVYQKFSEAKKEITRRAQEEFDKGAKTFLLKTLDYAKKLRPNAKWAFWAYPLCDYGVGYAKHSIQCSDMFQRATKKLMPVYEASGVLLPAIYFKETPADQGHRQFHAYGEIHHAFGINKALRHAKPVYAYGKFEYNAIWNETTQQMDERFYSEEDLCNTLKYTYDARCDLFESYLKKSLGPMAKAVVQEAETCAKEKCKGKGRCVAADPRPPSKCQLGKQRPMRCVPH